MNVTTTAKGWSAVYRSKGDKPVEIVITSQSKPTKRRTLQVAGRGLTVFTAVSIQRITNQHKGATPTMARKAATKDIDDELEELEAAFDDDDLEDLDELEDEEEEEVKPARKSRAKKAAAPAKKETAAQKRKRLAAEAAEEEDDEDEDEDDEDDEDDEPVAKKSSRTRKAAAKPAAKKPAAKKNEQPSQLTRELPTGKNGIAEILELADMDNTKENQRSLRIFLRKNAEDWPKDEELGRYAFNKRDAAKIAKQFAK